MSRPTRRWLLFSVIASLQCALPAVAEDTQNRAERRLRDAATSFESGDYQSAWFGFWSLAREGSPAAQFNLGQLYRLGVGVPSELGIARYWYGEAAAQGHPYAQYNLGLMYELGHGATADAVEAQAWYRRAAAHDVPGAYNALRRLEQRPRDNVAATRSSLSDATQNAPSIPLR